MKKQQEPKTITPLPIHFKKSGRSYSQIGRKGNVALYQVFSDYLIIPDFAMPYLCIGYELVVVKHNRRTGDERYPIASEFGSSAWSIPKSFSQPCLPRSGSSGFRFASPSCSTFETFPYRSAIAQESALLAAA